MTQFIPYPILFDPIYQPVMWGGHKLEDYKSRALPSANLPIGEAWEIVDREDAQSMVSNGVFKGRFLNDLIHSYPIELLGFETDRFPLLVKVIDANERLSLQVHPDELSAKLFKNNEAEPKTEMWYVLDASNGATIFSGLKPNISEESFFNTLHSNEIEAFLQIDHAQKGDCYFIQGGRVHAIGGGTLIFEVQQNSNTTYRLSDWGRVDSHGKSRQLHIEEAKKCVNFNYVGSAKVEYQPKEKTQILIQCPFFRVERHLLDTDIMLSTYDSHTATLVTAVESSVEIQMPHARISLPFTHTAFIPAACGEYNIYSKISTSVLLTKLVNPHL